MKKNNASVVCFLIAFAIFIVALIASLSHMETLWAVLIIIGWIFNLIGFILFIFFKK